MGRLPAVVVGLEHYHVTGWVETLGLYADRIEIVGRYDADPDRAHRSGPSFTDPNLPPSFPARFESIPFFDDLGTMMHECQPKLALVTLPNRDAPAAIERLANAGCHLLVDKPGARDAAGAQRSLEAVERAGVAMAVAFTRRYGRPWQRAAADIAAGRLGALLDAEAFFVTSSVAVRDPRNPIFDRAAMGGGILHWLGVHDIDLIHWLTGQTIVEVQAMSASVGAVGLDVEDTMSVAVRLSGGAIGTLHFAYALPRPGGDGYLALRGRDASVSITPDGTTHWIGPGTRSNPWLGEQLTSETAAVPGYGGAGAAIVADLLEAIDDERPPLATAAHARDALRVIDAIYESARTGRRLVVDSAMTTGGGLP